MKTIIISDLHLTSRFNKRTFNFLRDLISSVDKVIINGDFWDSYVTSFDKFVKSKWKALFPLLKEKNTHYNYGNHDRKKDCDDRVNLFSVTQAETLILKVAYRELLIKHGNDLKPAIVEKYPFLDKKLLSNLFYKYTYFPFSNFLQRISKGKFYKNMPHARRTVNNLKKWARENMGDDQILLCSHSHRGDMDWDNYFLSTGCIQNHWAEYLLIIDDEIYLKAHLY